MKPGATWPRLLWPPEVPQQQNSRPRAEDGGGQPVSPSGALTPRSAELSLLHGSPPLLGEAQRHFQNPDPSSSTTCLCGFSKALAEGHWMHQMCCFCFCFCFKTGASRARPGTRRAMRLCAAVKSTVRRDYKAKRLLTVKGL